MNKAAAIALANNLANEAEEATLDHAYFVQPSQNDTETWAVLELDRKGMAHVALWVSPTLSFSL